MVDLARLERAASTFAQSRSDSVELQVLMSDMLKLVVSARLRFAAKSRQAKAYRTYDLAEATGVEPAHETRGDLVPNRRDCHTVRRRLRLKPSVVIYVLFLLGEDARI